jgi:hypothetical protein
MRIRSIILAAVLALSAPCVGVAQTPLPDPAVTLGDVFPQDGGEKDRADLAALRASKEVFDLAMQRMAADMRAAIRDSSGAARRTALDAARSEYAPLAAMYADAVAAYGRERLDRIADPDRRWRIGNGLTVLHAEISRTPDDIRDDLEREARLARERPAGAGPERVTSPQAACALATERVTKLRGLPTSHVATCDDAAEGADANGYFVLALLAHCHEAVCGSTNMGWFAVRKSDGELFDWDVAEWQPGALVRRDP